MPTARKDIIRKGEEGVYHCYSRCVRRAFLCGQDPYTGQDFEHRKVWILERLQWLLSLFAIEAATPSIMSNHYHLILRTRPDLLNPLTLSDEQVVRNWLRTLPKEGRFDEHWAPRELDDAEVAQILQDPERVATLRSQLCDVSWFMACFNEYIARRANDEDDITGRFFDDRFGSQALLDEVSILACMVYVDLNPIRALIADSPECSLFTGAFDRIVARQAKEKIAALAQARREKAPEAPARGKLSAAQVQAIGKAMSERTQDRWLCPLDNRKDKGKRGSKGAARRGIIPLSTDEYLKLLDWTGRQIRSGKRGAIPAHLAPILQRLKLDVDAWLRMVEGLGKLFWRVVGRVEAIVKAARVAGKRWFKGMASSRAIFGST